MSNFPAIVMAADEVIGSYHDLWRVEQSFRRSKTGLRARPIFHHRREAIETHLAMVFAALAAARYLQQHTGVSLEKIITRMRPVQATLIRANGQTQKIPANIPEQAAQIIARITGEAGH
ncbi:hypothetical protein [Kocuria atrinae]|uniref:Transposase IS4-like domain-containing protein n=1 Tax=Kocuria atrinae TaxID=592377 RepID=A0ABN2Y8Z8_9MICC